MDILAARFLLDMQSDPRKLVRGARQPWFFPWRPVKRTDAETGKHVFISTASDLSWWRPMDVKMLHWDLNTLVRLQRPGSMTQQELLALRPTVDVYHFDIWAGDAAVQAQLWECVLQHSHAVNEFVI